MRAPRVTLAADSLREFEATHGRKPSGYGAWRFTLHRPGEFTVFEFTGDYYDARTLALREARLSGCHTIMLCM